MAIWPNKNNTHIVHNRQQTADRPPTSNLFHLSGKLNQHTTTRHTHGVTTKQSAHPTTAHPVKKNDKSIMPTPSTTKTRPPFLFLLCLLSSLLLLLLPTSTTAVCPTDSAQTVCPDGCGLANGLCTACVAGRFKMGVEMTSCSACTAGKYQNPGTAGAVQCLDCPKYTYSWKTGWVGNCFQCYSAASAGADTCTGCDPGKYNYDTNNATACKDCPEGYFTDDRDVRQCSACPIGYHAKNVHTTSAPHTPLRHRLSGCR